MNKTSLSILTCATLLGSLFMQPGLAALIQFNDRAAFIAATAAIETGPFSTFENQATSLTTGDVTLSNVPGLNTLTNNAEWSTLIPNSPDLAVNGIESFNVQTAFDMYSFGFDFHEPSLTTPPNPGRPDTCNTAVCVDSLFQVTLLSAGTITDTFDFSRPDDSLEFVGFWSDMAFDRIEIREIVGTADNEFFGNFLRGTTPAIPEPGSLALLGLGLIGLRVTARKKAVN